MNGCGEDRDSAPPSKNELRVEPVCSEIIGTTLVSAPLNKISSNSENIIYKKQHTVRMIFVGCPGRDGSSWLPSWIMAPLPDVGTANRRKTEKDPADEECSCVALRHWSAAGGVAVVSWYMASRFPAPQSSVLSAWQGMLHSESGETLASGMYTSHPFGRSILRDERRGKRARRTAFLSELKSSQWIPGRFAGCCAALCAYTSRHCDSIGEGSRSAINSISEESNFQCLSDR